MTAGRWRVGLAATLVLTGTGLVFAEPTLLAVTVVPLVYVGYGLLSGLSGEPGLRVTRQFDPESPVPGETVTVTLRIENTGDSVLPDLRVVDGVPELAVVEGSPRGAVALAPGETASLSYGVVARRGDHTFDPPMVQARSLAASETWTDERPVDDGTILRCQLPSQDPLADAVRTRLSRRATGGAGEGTEFYATREYRRGDPMRRIDWRHVAKTGEFVTVQYRDQRATRTVVVVDVRGPTRVRPTAGSPSGATLALDTGERLLTALDPVDGLGVVGVDPTGPLSTVGRLAWTDATTGQSEPAVLLGRVFDQLDADRSESAVERTVRPPRGTQPAPPGAGAGTARPDGGPGWGWSTGDDGTTMDGSSGQPSGDLVEQLLEQLQPETQLILCTPALDDWPVTFARAATDRGHGLVIVSPAVGRTGAVGTRLAGLHRRLRLRRLAELGVVLDWSPETAVREVV